MGTADLAGETAYGDGGSPSCCLQVLSDLIERFLQSQKQERYALKERYEP